MAERRMFTKKITESDAFLDMPTSAQALYFHLSMNADDDGFINNPNSIRRTVGASEDDLKILLAKKFIIHFESGVIVIKHWKMHNYIQKDRYKPTDYIEERSCLSLDDKNAYSIALEPLKIEDSSKMDTECIQNGDIGKVRLGKDRIGKVRLGKDINTSVSKETVSRILDYLNQATGRNYKASSKATQKHINARFSEGYTEEDFKKVIDNKVSEWLHNPKMQAYLRPDTLFSTKFDSYLNQEITEAKPSIEINPKQREGMTDVVKW